MTHGGSRPGAGRPQGSKNKRTVEVEAKARETAALIEAVVAGAFTGDAHALLVAVYKDPAQPIELRLEAAKSAIRFEKPALAAVDHTSLGERVIMGISDKPMSDEEWLEAHGDPSKH